MSLFEYKDYRPFIRQYLHKLPNKGYGEISRIAEALGVHSSLISQVLAGAKGLSLEQAQTFCVHIGLGLLETDYFMLLVQHEKAGTATLREYWNKKIENVRKKSKQISKRLTQDRALTDMDRAVFYSSWLYSAVRLFASIGNGQTLEAIAERFQIERAKAAEILAFLVETQLCVEKNGKYSMGPQRTHLPQDSVFVPRLHANWRVKSLARVDQVRAEELMFTAPLSIHRKDFEKVRELLVDVISATSKIVGESEPQDVACLNIDFLWVKSN